MMYTCNKGISQNQICVMLLILTLLCEYIYNGIEKTNTKGVVNENAR